MSALKSLDRYEGVKNGLYRRVFINGMLTYRMNNTDIAPPAKGYFDTIMMGYKDFDLDETYLWGAALDAQNHMTEKTA